jgi:flagellar biosynthesis protein FlhG
LNASERPDSYPEPRLGLEPPARQVWAIGGGKGGIGKSFLAANLAATVARSGRQVVLIDADLGGANLHTCLGVRGPARVNLNDYLEERIVDLEKAAIETPIPKLRLIVGALGQAGAPETTLAQREELIRAVRELDADHIVLDLAGGCDRATLDFFLVSDDREHVRLHPRRVLSPTGSRHERLAGEGADPGGHGSPQRARHPDAGRSAR